MKTNKERKVAAKPHFEIEYANLKDISMHCSKMSDTMVSDANKRILIDELKNKENISDEMVKEIKKETDINIELNDLETIVHSHESIDKLLFYLDDAHTYIYDVTIRITLKSGIEEIKQWNPTFYILNLVYVAKVKIDDNEDNKDGHNEILTKDVPRRLFEDIALIIYNTTKETGYPMDLTERRFMKSIQNRGIVKLKSVNYHNILRRLLTHEEVVTFIATYEKYTGRNESMIFDYKSLPAYRFYLKYFTPIKYKIPDWADEDDELWPMLFQLVFGDFNCECEIKNIRGEDKPDIKIRYKGYVGNGEIENLYRYDGLISEITIEDLVVLLDELITDMLVDVSVELIDLACFEINEQNGYSIFDDIYNVEMNYEMEPEYLEKMKAKIEFCVKEKTKYRKHKNIES